MITDHRYHALLIRQIPRHRLLTTDHARRPSVTALLRTMTASLRLLMAPHKMLKARRARVEERRPVKFSPILVALQSIGWHLSRHLLGPLLISGNATDPSSWAPHFQNVAPLDNSYNGGKMPSEAARCLPRATWCLLRVCIIRSKGVIIPPRAARCLMMRQDVF